MLAALAVPAQGGKQASAWGDDGLEDDVATLSYERALRTHARFRLPDAGDHSLTQTPDPAPIDIGDALPASANPRGKKAGPLVPPAMSADVESEATQRLPRALDRNLKCTSITIRLSTAEYAQLHKRAAEAGLTVSAYVRSCTFEVESLRAQVKEALAELRSAAPRRDHTGPTPVRRAWLPWLLRIFPPWRSSQRIAGI
jgi:hypothetical protein